MASTTPYAILLKDAKSAAKPIPKSKAMFPQNTLTDFSVVRDPAIIVWKVVLKDDTPSNNNNEKDIATYNDFIVAESKGYELLKESEEHGFKITKFTGLGRDGGLMVGALDLQADYRNDPVWVGVVKTENGEDVKRYCYVKKIEIVDEAGMEGVIT